jgi:hypothetical protein
MHEEEKEMHIRAHKTRRIFKALILGFSVAFITVPMGQAGHADRGAVPAAIAGGQVTVDAGMLDILVGDAIRAEQASPELDPLIAGAIRAEQASPELDPLIADAIRAAEPRIVSPDGPSLSRSAPQPSRQVTPSTSDGFEWRDAGAGAAGMLVFVLLGAGATLGVYRHRRRLAAP